MKTLTRATFVAVGMVLTSLSGVEAQQPTVTLVKSRTVPWKMPNGKKTKMVLIDWKNTGKVPVKAVYAEINVFDKQGRKLMGSTPDYTVFYTDNPKSAIGPGKTYKEPDGEGYVLVPIDGVPDRATVKIVRAK